MQGSILSATANVLAAANISAVGTVFASQLSLSGNIISAISSTSNITGANVNATNALSAVGNITGGNISTAGNLAAPTAAQNTNTTQVATTAYVIGQASSSTPAAIAATAVIGTGTTFARADHVHSGVTSITAGTSISVSAAAGAVTVNNTGVTSVVAGTGVGVSAGTGAVTVSIGQAVATTSTPTFAALTVATGNITLGNIVNGGANAVGNIGSATGYFNTGFLKATTAQYADLAENYLADADYVPGTVVDFGGEYEITISNAGSTRVAGVVSTNPAHLMNSTLDGKHVTAVALTGRVPTQVVGPISKGDMMISAGNGKARACTTPAIGSVIGKALANFDGDHGVIEVVIGKI